MMMTMMTMAKTVVIGITVVENDMGHQPLVQLGHLAKRKEVK
jgi:hypothetical protein